MKVLKNVANLSFTLFALQPELLPMDFLTRLLPDCNGCHAQTMRRNALVCAFAALLLCSLPGSAQDKGYWRATSNNAIAITGDLSISESKLSINLTAFIMAQIRPLKPAEASAAFDADINEGGSGYLYRTNVPAAKRFLHKNTLCGSDDTQWMATYVHGRILRIAFFSGTDMPVITPDALANSTDVCGTFTYSR